MRILLVEDDLMLGDGIHAGLKQMGYTIDWVKDGQAALTALHNETFEAILLDIGLPKRTGLEVLRELRSQGRTEPVLILTARDSIADRIAGLDGGADDYLGKPFELGELYARLRALTRRSSARSTPNIVYGNLVLDPAAHTVTVANELINMPRREFALLYKLLENVGKVLSREQLSQSLYGWGEEVDSNALEVHIHNLRKKLNATYIRTIRGVGYMVDKEE